MTVPILCPACKADMTGAEIPPQDREHYGVRKHYDRRIGVYSYRRDRTTHWRCPDCGHEWERR